MKRRFTLTAFLLALTPLVWAQDRLTELDRVRTTGAATQLEWLFNMGLVSGVNPAGEPRHFAVVFNTLIGPHLNSIGPLPVLDFNSKPVILLTLHDLDRREVFQSQVQSDVLDPANFDVRTLDGRVFATRTDSAAGVVTHLRARTEAFGFALQILSTKPQALFGDQGWADNGSLGKALYLSRTGRTLDPTFESRVERGGETIHLTEGQFWEDHQLVDPLHLDLTKLKWNWFALHFGDHSEAMIYRIENKKTGEVYSRFAQRVKPDGSIESLERSEIIETSHQVSRGHRVPTAWDITIPGKASFHLKHLIPSPWYDVALGKTHDSALEGACQVEGTTPWGEVTLAWAEYTSSDFFRIGN